MKKHFILALREEINFCISRIFDRTLRMSGRSGVQLGDPTLTKCWGFG